MRENEVRFERVRQFGNGYRGLELWKRLGLDRFWEALLDEEAADVAREGAYLLRTNLEGETSEELWKK